MTDTRDGFARIPDWLTRHAVPALGLTAAEGFAYVAVRSRADADGLAWPSYPTIANETGTSESTAARAMKRLVQVGLLEVVEVGRQHQATVYRVVERPSLPPKPDRPLSKSERRRAQAPHRGVPEVGSSPSQAPHGDAQAPHGEGLRLLTVGSEVDTVKKTQEVDTDVTLRGARDRADDGDSRWALTDAQQRNVLDAITAVHARCDSIDVLGFGEVELAYLDGLSADERRARMAVWSGLRSRALTDAGDDLVVDDRLHDLLFAHGYVSPEPDGAESSPWRADSADDVNADGQSRLSALLPAFTVPDEQRRQPPAPTSRARASTAHRHVFDPVSGYCGCGHRNDRLEAS